MLIKSRLDLRTISRLAVVLLFLLAGSACTSKTGTVVIESSPPGASVMVDGESQGITPLVLKHIPAGQWEGSLEREGYEPEPIKLVVQAGKDSTTSIDLTPYLSVMLRDAGRMNSPQAAVQWLVASAAMQAAEGVGMGPFPELPIEAYWSRTLTESADGRLYATSIVYRMSHPIYIDFKGMPSENQVMGTLSLWVVPDDFWDTRMLLDGLALVQFRYGGRQQWNFLVILDEKVGVWRVYRHVDWDLDFDSIALGDIIVEFFIRGFMSEWQDYETE